VNVMAMIGGMPALTTNKALTLYADLACRIAKDSYCKRLQVGCVIVKGGNIISMGYNGTVSGWDNTCEKSPGISSNEVLHAEENAILKLARDGGGAAGATAVCTDACCLSCAKMIYRSGIDSFYYIRPYRLTDGIDFLRKAGVMVYEFPHILYEKKILVDVV
jgi:deoxycytidylate deaminase